MTRISKLVSPVAWVMLFAVAALGALGGLPQGENLQAAEKETAEKATAEKKIDINTASLDELTSLPDIGKAKAQRIIDHRLHVGPFRKIEELLVIPGISRRIFEKIRHLITVGEVQPSGEPDAS